jgi:hypothetical protein
MKVLFSGLVAVLILLYFIHPIPLQGLNVDLGHHLLFGKIMIAGQKILDTNLVSYTHPDFHFVNSQWLSQVVIYLWHNLFGFNGLIVLSSFLFLTAFLLIFLYSAKENFNSSLLVSVFYIQLIIDRTEVKPEIFSWLFMSVFLLILYKFRKSYTKLIFILIPLQILWINFHIFYFVGNVLLLLFLIEEFTIRHDIKSEKFKTLLVVNLFSGLGLLINPWFFRGAAYPLYVLNDYGYKVIENLNFFTAFSLHRDITFYYYIFCLIVLWIGILKYRKKLSVVNIMLSAFFTFMSLYAVRNIPMFVFGTFISMTGIVRNAVGSFSKKSMQIIFFTALLTVIPAIRWNFEVHGFGFGVIDAAQESVDFIKNNHLTGPIYNNYNIGNYLEYRIYPWQQVFVDGNPEEYPGEFFSKIYYPMEQSFTNFTSVSDKYNFNLVYYDHVNQATDANPVLSGLMASPHWKLIYLNNRIVIFIKNIPKNKIVIDNFEISQDSLVINSSYLSDKNTLRDLSNLFRVFGWYQKMYDMDMEYLKYDPENCVALRHVVAVMKSQGHPLQKEYSQKFISRCSPSVPGPSQKVPQ